MEDAVPDTQPQSLPDSKVANDGQKHQQSSNGRSNKKKRCRQCQECRMPDCGTCKFCRDKKKFGGPGKLKKSCVKRHCTMLHETSLNGSAVPTLNKTEVLRDLLTSPNYVKLGDFPDKPIPPEVLELLQSPVQPKKQCDITHAPSSSTESQNPTNLRGWQLLFSFNFLLPLQHSERTSTGSKGNSRIRQ